MKKNVISKRNTRRFYALLCQLDEYNPDFKAEIKEIEVVSFLQEKYGPGVYNASLAALTDEDYDAVLKGLETRIARQFDPKKIIEQTERKKYISEILSAFSTIGVNVISGNYGNVNKHIRKLPISKGRILPQIPTSELHKVVGAVRAYCDNLQKQQRLEKSLAFNN